MNISKRLLLMSVVAVLGLIGTGIMNLVQMHRVYDAANYGNENVVPSILLIDKAETQFLIMRIRATRHVLNTDPKVKADLDKLIADADKNVSKALSDYKNFVSNEEDRRLLETETQLFASFMAGLNKTLELSRQNQQEQARIAQEDLTNIARDFQNSLQNHMKFNEKLGEEVTQHGVETMNSVTFLAALVTLAVIAVVGLVALQIRRDVTRRLQQANAMALAIATGDLSSHHTPTDVRDDEVGQLVMAMDTMRQDLAKTVGAMMNSSHHLSESASHLSSSSQHVLSATNQQTASTASSAAALEELTVSIEHVGSSADEASEEAVRAGQLTGSSAQGVREATEQIGQVSANVLATARDIQTLSEHIQQIGNITTVIREVAEQTNLLALNAAIEAARAGEQGRGFAVVADEVRKLAERTSLSVEDITKVVATIQGSVEVAVQSMNNNCQMVSAVVSVAEKASASMDTIREATDRVTHTIQSISEAMREQRSAATELSRNVEAVAQMSEQNSASVDAVASTAATVQGVSQELKAVVTRFKL